LCGAIAIHGHTTDGATASPLFRTDLHPIRDDLMPKRRFVTFSAPKAAISTPKRKKPIRHGSCFTRTTLVKIVGLS
jgi:hypothetical protein